MTPEQKQQATAIILKHYDPIKDVVQNNPGMLLDANIMQAIYKELEENKLLPENSTYQGFIITIQQVLQNTLLLQQMQAFTGGGFTFEF